MEQQRQLSLQLQSFVAQNSRLQSVYHRIATANAEFCGSRVTNRLGFVALTAQDVPERYRAIAPSVLNLDSDHPTVLAVAESGAAHRAGLHVGDLVLAFDGQPVPSQGASAWVANFLTSKGRGSIRIDVLRGGKQVKLLAIPETACAHPISLALDNETNAFTDGRQIVVNSGLLRLTQSDAELASILGHELAHITMGHLEKRAGNQVAGAFGGFLVDVALAAAGVNSQGAFTRGFGDVGAKAFAKEFEREADYVGAYYVARAGYDPAQSEGVWRTLAQVNPTQIFFAGQHPTTPERFLLLQQANAEIGRKRSLNLPLRPELKATAPATSVASSQDSTLSR